MSLERKHSKASPIPCWEDWSEKDRKITKYCLILRWKLYEVLLLLEKCPKCEGKETLLHFTVWKKVSGTWNRCINLRRPVSRNNACGLSASWTGNLSSFNDILHQYLQHGWWFKTVSWAASDSRFKTDNQHSWRVLMCWPLTFSKMQFSPQLFHPC